MRGADITPISTQARAAPSGSPRLLELIASEAAHLGWLPLTLTDGRGGRIVVPAGTRDGDELWLGADGRRIIVPVRLTAKT